MAASTSANISGSDSKTSGVPDTGTIHANSSAGPVYEICTCAVTVAVPTSNTMRSAV